MTTIEIDPAGNHSEAPAAALSSEKYQAIGRLGTGGMADVHLAVSRGRGGFNKLVVLKSLRAGFADMPEFLQMFWNEARLSSRLNHPNVVQVYEVLEGSAGPVLVMEYLEGASLDQLAARAPTGGLPLGIALRIVADALSGLHYAHELRDYDGTPLNLVHRDISPQNIHLTFDGQVKVLDFGIARAKGLSCETQHGVVKGKIRYMPLEQMQGEQLDRRADIYAMGVVLWELVTGVRVWSGCSDIEVMHRSVRGIPPPTTVKPGLPAALDALVARAVAPAAADRYPTCLDFQREIEVVLDAMGERVQSRDVGSLAATLFAEVLAARRLKIHRLMSEAQSSGDDAPTAIVTTTGTLPSLAFTPRTLTTHRASRVFAAGTRAGEKASPSRLVRRLATVGTFALAAMAVLLWRATGGAPVQPASLAQTHASFSTVAAAAEPAPAPASPRLGPSVRLVVHASPANANVYLDDVLLTGEPPSRTQPADSVLHVVRVERARYATKTAQISLDADADLSIALTSATLVAETGAAPRAKSPRAPDASKPGASPGETAPGAAKPARVPRALDTAIPWQ